MFVLGNNWITCKRLWKMDNSVNFFPKNIFVAQKRPLGWPTRYFSSQNCMDYIIVHSYWEYILPLTPSDKSI